MINYCHVQNMMVSTMLYCKNISFIMPRFFLLALMLFAFQPLAMAAGSSITVKSADMLEVEDNYEVNALFDLSLAKEVEEALNKGVSLTFLIEFQLTSPRKYWFDSVAASEHSKVTLSYHALSKQYLINRDNQQQSFVTLAEAKAELGIISDWPVIKRSALNKDASYKAVLLIRLDKSKLLKPLQVDAISSEVWNISSLPYSWSPTINRAP